MRIANINDRSVLVTDTVDGLRGIDIAEGSNGRFSANTRDLLVQMDDLRDWAAETDTLAGSFEIAPTSLGSPISEPRQIFAIGLNYAAHAEEVAIASSDVPTVFTKYASSLVGAEAEVALPSRSVDWEVEMVAIVGRGGRNISKEDALDRIAGYAVGQDISCRELQFAAKASPQFSIGKSYAGFAPVGPWMTTADEVPQPGALSMRCAIDGEIVQQGSTENLIFDIPTLIAHLSSVVELLPGDLIFTGTPDGVGFGRTPQRYLRSGERLVSSIEGLGEIRQAFV